MVKISWENGASEEEESRIGLRRYLVVRIQDSESNITVATDGGALLAIVFRAP